MPIHGLVLIIFYCLFPLLAGCLGGVWTGASLIYDRHNVYKKVSDYSMTATSHRALHKDKTFRAPGSAVDLTVFKDKILISGHVPSEKLRKEAESRILSVSGKLPVYNELQIAMKPANRSGDSWITTKIRMAVLADSSIDPNGFKVITSDGIVYLLGNMHYEEAEKLVDIARNVEGVVKVVKILRYIHYVKNDQRAKIFG